MKIPPDFKYLEELNSLKSTPHILINNKLRISNDLFEKILLPFYTWISKLRIINKLNFIADIHNYNKEICIEIRTPFNTVQREILIPREVNHIIIGTILNTKVTIMSKKSIIISKDTYKNLSINYSYNNIIAEQSMLTDVLNISLDNIIAIRDKMKQLDKDSPRYRYNRVRNLLTTTDIEILNTLVLKYMNNSNKPYNQPYKQQVIKDLTYSNINIKKHTITESMSALEKHQTIEALNIIIEILNIILNTDGA